MLHLKKADDGDGPMLLSLPLIRTLTKIVDGVRSLMLEQMIHVEELLLIVIMKVVAVAMALYWMADSHFLNCVLKCYFICY